MATIFLEMIVLYHSYGNYILGNYCSIPIVMATIFLEIIVLVLSHSYGNYILGNYCSIPIVMATIFLEIIVLYP